MDLNTILIILGVLALVGLITHGIWTNRREKSQYFNNANTFNRQPTQDMESTPKPTLVQEEQIDSSQIDVQTAVPVEDSIQIKVEEELPTESCDNIGKIKITLPNNEAVKPEQKVYYEYIPEHHSSSANITDKTLMELEDYENTEEGIHSASSNLTVQLQDVALQASPILENSLQQPIQAEQMESIEKANERKTDLEFILLYVVAPENGQFHGASLANSLDSLGCVFGKDDIYHRHIDTIATPIIFSVANVNQPGTFNPYAMNDFFTVGVAFFMQIPSVIGNDKANLRMMIQAAKNLADELGGFVLTDEQKLFDETAEQEYLSRLM